MKTIVISSGHALGVAGAVDLVAEVKEARRITNAIAEALEGIMNVIVYHDDTSKTQKENITRIVNKHNSYERVADYSVHLNASNGRQNKDIGTEVLCYSQANLSHAEAIAAKSAAAVGLKNRGGKIRKDLGFLKGTNRPAWLIEAYFVNSYADVGKMDEEHEVRAYALAVAQAIAAQHGVKWEEIEKVPKQPNRIVTGTFEKEADAAIFIERASKAGLISKKWAKVYKEGDRYRVHTGVFGSKEEAAAALTAMQKSGFLNVGYVQKA